MSTILVVDDNIYVVDVLLKMLKHGGYLAFGTYSGEECQTVLKNITPDLILLDIMMEPMDGWKTLEKIKGGSTTAQIPVIMLTSKNVTPAEVENYGKYIEDYVLKPVTNIELYNVIEHVFQRRQIIKADVGRAVQRGIYPDVIDEYAHLSRSIDINSRFLNIFETGYILDESSIY
ncbi:response regulator, partial [Methanoregula sp.]